jgi:hypothetical protein
LTANRTFKALSLEPADHLMDRLDPTVAHRLEVSTLRGALKWMLPGA